MSAMFAAPVTYAAAPVTYAAAPDPRLVIVSVPQGEGPQFNEVPLEQHDPAEFARQMEVFEKQKRAMKLAAKKKRDAAWKKYAVSFHVKSAGRMHGSTLETFYKLAAEACGEVDAAVSLQELRAGFAQVLADFTHIMDMIPVVFPNAREEVTASVFKDEMSHEIKRLRKEEDVKGISNTLWENPVPFRTPLQRAHTSSAPVQINSHCGSSAVTYAGGPVTYAAPPVAAMAARDGLVIETSPDGSMSFDAVEAGARKLFRKIEKKIDRDGDGTLSVEEILKHLEEFAKPDQKASLERRVNLMDKDGDGNIDEDEFVMQLTLEIKGADGGPQ